MTAQEKTTRAHRLLQSLNLEDKKRLIQELLDRKSRDVVLAPMSKGQEALWYIHQSAPDSAAYNVAMAFHIHSPVERDKLEQALQLLAQRHEILRTSYAVVQGQNFQQIHPRAELQLQVVDARILTEEQLHARIVAHYRQPFDLSSPPVRAHFYQLAHGESVFLLVVHHIATDAASLGILMEELAEIYPALCHGQQPRLREAGLSYREFCRQQANLLAGEKGRADRDYWTSTLSPDHPALTLDISRPRPALQVYEGATHHFDIPAALSAQISTLAQARGITPFSFCLAAWYCLLARHSGQQDLCVSSPTAGRMQAGFQRSVGYFVNPVILRASLEDNPCVGDFLDRVQQRVLEALEHQQYPFASVIEAVNPRRDPAYTPLAQVSFVFQRPQQEQGLLEGWAPGQAGPRIRWAGLEVRQYPLNQQEGQFELELEITANRDRLYGTLKFNSTLFDRAQMQKLAGHYCQLLQAMAAQPDAPVAQLEMLTPEEYLELDSWNQTRRDYPPHRSLHQLIENQVARTPDGVALQFGEGLMTYAAMNAAANRLAHFLIREGVTVETKVGVCMERSFDMVIALLAALKAGAAYVPVDPHYPAARVAFLLGDMQAPLVLTQAHLLENLPQLDARVVCVDQLDLRDCSDANPQVEVGPHNLAYMIYTSGSTGNPKGAMNTHAGICNRLLWMQEAYGLAAGDAVLQKTPFSFDVSVWEFFWPLLAGARLVVAKPDGHKDVDYLLSIIRQERITTLHFVPSMLSLFVAHQGAGDCPSLRRVICSGEALSHDLQERFFARLPRVELHNLYGPTEAAVDVTYWQCQPDSKGTVVPIGRPIANIQLHIVDRHLQRVPVGVTGELLIGGVGLARGYFGRDQLTAERFIADPFSNDPEARLYRTGDLVRYLPDGNIEYLQRMDDQVKLRGFRIELGEVEAMLNRCRGVRESVCVKRSHPSAGEYLLAFATRDGEEVEVNEVLAEVEQLLPAHCVPSALVFLPSLPLTPNGKLDRRALPEHQFAGGTGAVVAPRNEVERRLHRIWRELLQVERLSITDNFFSLGGHSLLAVRLMAAIETSLGKRLPLASLVRGPTIAELAQQIEAPEAQDWSSLVPIQERGEGTPLFFVPGGGGNVLYFYPLAEQLGGARPFFGLQSRGLDGISQPLQSARQIAVEMVQEIRRAQPQGPYVIGGHCVGGLVAFAIAQQLLAEGEQVAQLLIMDAPAPHFFVPREGEALSEAQWISVLVGTVAHMTGQALALDPAELEALESDMRLARLRALLAGAGMVPENTPLAQVRGLLQVFMANAQLHHEAREGDAPVPITLFRAREINPHYDYSPCDDPQTDLATSTLGWSRYASGPVRVELVDGDHITMLAPRQAGGLAAALARTLTIQGV